MLGGSEIRRVDIGECIQFFVIVILDAGIGLEERLTLAHEMLAATALRAFARSRHIYVSVL